MAHLFKLIVARCFYSYLLSAIVAYNLKHIIKQLRLIGSSRVNNLNIKFFLLF